MIPVRSLWGHYHLLSPECWYLVVITCYNIWGYGFGTWKWGMIKLIYPPSMAIKCHGENDDEPSHLWGYGILISNKLLESYVFSALISLITKVSLSKRPGFLITIHFKQSSQSIWMFSQYILQRLGGLLHWSSAENVHNFYIWYTVFLDFSMSICSCIYAICIRYIYMCIDVLTTTKIRRSSHMSFQNSRWNHNLRQGPARWIRAEPPVGSFCRAQRYPLVNIQKTMENHHF